MNFNRNLLKKIKSENNINKLEINMTITSSQDEQYRNRPFKINSE